MSKLVKVSVALIAMTFCYQAMTKSFFKKIGNKMKEVVIVEVAKEMNVLTPEEVNQKIVKEKKQDVKIWLGNLERDRYRREARKDARIRRLERAVQQLQEQVFNLTLAKNSAPQEVWVCEVSAFSDTFMGEHAQKAKAKSIAVKKCLKKRSAMFCKKEEVTCEK